MSDLPFEWQGRIPPDCLILDEYELVLAGSGETVRPHGGEVVWCHIYGGSFAHAMQSVAKTIDGFTAALRANDYAAMDQAGLAMAALVCERAIHWTITDPEAGDAYPQPSEGAKAVYDALPSELLLWLFQRLAGIEAGATRGKGSSGSPTGSSTTPSRRRKSK